jgi:hypothetical protein
VSARNPRKAERGAHPGWLCAGVVAGLMVGGCAANQARVEMPASSVQAVQYYPFQVKGYENTYPKRRAMVVAAVDTRDFKDAGSVVHAASAGHPAIGVVFDQENKVGQLLYGPPLEGLMQAAIVEAAAEAGLVATASPLTLPDALTARKADYVISTSITRCWVSKHRGPDHWAGPSWSAVADVALAVAVYKPPFDVAFWNGEVSATYNDPPAPFSGGGSADETEIYDQPGEVLSVALTRAVAGIFQREELHSLIDQDPAGLH